LGEHAGKGGIRTGGTLLKGKYFPRFEGKEKKNEDSNMGGQREKGRLINGKKERELRLRKTHKRVKEGEREEKEQKKTWWGKRKKNKVRLRHRRERKNRGGGESGWGENGQERPWQERYRDRKERGGSATLIQKKKKSPEEKKGS